MTATAIAPGPKPSLLEAFSYRPGREPLAFFTNLARTYGDVVAYRLGGERLIFVNDPQQHQGRPRHPQPQLHQRRALQRTKRLLGEGLLTSEGATHLRQRRLMQPAFHRERIAAYAARWSAMPIGCAAHGGTARRFDVAQRDESTHAVDRRQDAVRRRRRVAGG
jgi:cytochrome P450